MKQEQLLELIYKEIEKVKWMVEDIQEIQKKQTDDMVKIITNRVLEALLDREKYYARKQKIQQTMEKLLQEYIRDLKLSNKSLTEASHELGMTVEDIKDMFVKYISEKGAEI